MNQDSPTAETVTYQIKVQGELDEKWADWFSGMAITHEGDITTLTGAVADQSALRGILDRIWNLNLIVVSVARIEE
jgi:hypothetical protein